jgi:hypothetical protein
MASELLNVSSSVCIESVELFLCAESARGTQLHQTDA